MQIRLTKKEDLPKLLAIYEHARQYMVQNNNPNQWGKSKPSITQVIKDIENNNLLSSNGMLNNDITSIVQKVELDGNNKNEWNNNF